MKKAKVVLVNSTPNPIETMCWARRVMHAPVPDEIVPTYGIQKNHSTWLGMSYDKYVDEVLLKDGMPTFLEYVQVVFKLENVSRALQQQLTRHRIGFSYSIQSLRCVDLPNFASDHAYYNPYKHGSDEYFIFHGKMFNIQQEYKFVHDIRMPTQDIRGLLPMNIHSTITFSCTLRALIGMLNKRLCLKTQGEFREVAQLMMKEIETKMDKRILKWIGAPCDAQNYCMMKGENEQQHKEGKTTGAQNTDHMCPKYNKFLIPRD